MLVFIEPIRNFTLSVIGIVFLVAGVTGMTISGSDVFERLFSAPEPEQNPSLHGEGEKLIPKRPSNLYSLDISWSSSAPVSGSKRFIGIICAVSIGLTNGTILVPLLYSLHAPIAKLTTSQIAEVGQMFLISFGISILVATPFIAAVYFFVSIKFFNKRPTFNVRLFPVTGMTSGFIWNLGNCFSAFAVLYLGIGCGYPLAHMGLFISGVWSILVFQEIRGPKSIGLFISSSLFLIGGGILLALNGHPGFV